MRRKYSTAVDSVGSRLTKLHVCRNSYLLLLLITYVFKMKQVIINKNKIIQLLLEEERKKEEMRNGSIRNLIICNYFMIIYYEGYHIEHDFFLLSSVTFHLPLR